MGYADDTTLLSASPEDHQTALRQVDSKCSDLGLEIRPDKCVSYVFDGQKLNSRTTFEVHHGSTRNITSAPTKFLGQTIDANPTNIKLHVGKKLTERVYAALNEINPSEASTKLGSTNSTLFPHFCSASQYTTSPKAP